MSLEAIVGVVVTVIVMPIGGLVASIVRNQSRMDKRVTALETNQTWIQQSVLKVETTQNEMRKEVNEKLDTVVEHLLKKK